MDIGARVNGLLQKKGYGAKSELARVLGISPSRLGHYLNGRIKWPLELVSPSAEFLGVPAHDLLDLRPTQGGSFLPGKDATAGVMRTDYSNVVRVPEFIATPGRFGLYAPDTGTGIAEVPGATQVGDAVAFQEGTHVPASTAIVAVLAGEPPRVQIAQVETSRGRNVSLLQGGSIERPAFTVPRDALLGYAVAIVRWREDEVTMCRYEEGGIVPGKLHYWDRPASSAWDNLASS